jgi:hypothetical protein
MENHGGMISVGDILIRPPELSGNPTSSHLVGKQEEFGEGNDEFGLTKFLCSYFEGSLTYRKILRHGADGFSSPQK